MELQGSTEEAEVTEQAEDSDQQDDRPDQLEDDRPDQLEDDRPDQLEGDWTKRAEDNGSGTPRDNRPDQDDRPDQLEGDWSNGEGGDEAAARSEDHEGRIGFREAALIAGAALELAAQGGALAADIHTDQVELNPSPQQAQQRGEMPSQETPTLHLAQGGEVQLRFEEKPTGGPELVEVPETEELKPSKESSDKFNEAGEANEPPDFADTNPLPGDEDTRRR